MAFILAFINKGIPMNKNCTISSKQCQSNSLEVFTCRMSNELMDCNQITVHACNDSAICHSCFNEQYPTNETKSDSEYNDWDKEDFSSISTLHSP